LKALDRIASDRLSNDDAEIRDVAGYIARVVTGEQRVSADDAASTPSKHADQIANAIENPKIADALDHADAILEKADQLILGKRQ
jgi:chemotaxis protein MotC